MPLDLNNVYIVMHLEMISKNAGDLSDEGANKWFYETQSNTIIYIRVDNQNNKK